MNSMINFDNLKRLDTVFLYYILLAFFLVNAGWIFGEHGAIFRDMLFVYALTFLIFTKRAPQIGGGSFVSNLPVNLIYTVAVVFIVALVPIQQLGLYSTGVIFPNIIIAFLWYVCIVGYTETIIFAVFLAEKLGIVVSSVIFALFHSQTIQVLNQGVVFTELEVIFLFAKLFIMNVLFCFVYKYTKSIYLTALIHGCINLAKMGLLTIIAWRLFV